MDPISSNPIATAEFGQRGVIVETGATALTGLNAYAIQCLADTTFATLTESGKSGDNMTGFAIPAGLTIYGNFTAITLTSGKIRIYIK
jgi:hypothetical protein